MASGKKLRVGAWTTGVLSACFLTFGIGGTALGNYIIKEHLHGDTMEKHKQFCRESFEKAASYDGSFTYTQDDINGCAAEKRRGYLSASAAHATIQTVSLGALGVLVPMTVLLGAAGYGRRQQDDQGPRP